MQAKLKILLALATVATSACSASPFLQAQGITYSPAFNIQKDYLSSGNLHVTPDVLGDVNMDGVSDFLISDIVDSDGTRHVSVHSGSDGDRLVVIAGEGGGDAKGIGDFNGDGYPDLIAGFAGDDTNGTNAGRASIYSGRDGTALLSVYGDATGDFLGYSVDRMGDVNNDGIEDFVASSPFVDQPFGYDGRVRVYSGADGNIIHTIDPVEAVEDNFGRITRSMGDLDGDNVNEVLIRTTIGNLNASTVEVQVFSGRTGLFIDKISGAATDSFGLSIDGVGDVNLDGHADFIIGARREEVGGIAAAGTATVYSGIDRSVLFEFSGDSELLTLGSTVGSVGDANGDGIPDFIVSGQGGFGIVNIYSGLNGELIAAVQGDSVLGVGENDSFGNSTAGIGDINNDGLSDFIVGARSGGEMNSGYYVVFVSNAVPEPVFGMPILLCLVPLALQRSRSF